MNEEELRRLADSRHYCADRLVELKAELGRLRDQSLELKSKLEGADEVEAGQMRRRRRYLSRRLAEIKSERTVVTAEMQDTTEKLRALQQSAMADQAQLSG